MDASAQVPSDAVAGDAPRAVRGLLAAFADALRTRLDLAAVELEIHLRTLLRALVWTVGAVVCGLMALALAVTAFIMALWNTHRMLGLLGGSALFLALTVICGYFGARALRMQQGIFGGSLEQLQEDQRRAAGEL